MCACVCVRGQPTVRYIAMDIFESKEKGDLPLQRGDVSEHILFPLRMYLARVSLIYGETSDIALHAQLIDACPSYDPEWLDAVMVMRTLMD